MAEQGREIVEVRPEDDPAVRKLRKQFGERIHETHAHRGDVTVYVEAAVLRDVARFLRENPELDFDMLVDITAVDHLPAQPRFEVVYHFLSLKNLRRLRVKVRLDGEEPSVPSLAHDWGCANWLEREVWDMFGIRFEGHPDLRRILLYESFEGHPLRKDYPIRKRQPQIGPRN
jgi:NADH-quinone oxidoreductase subunit C